MLAEDTICNAIQDLRDQLIKARDTGANSELKFELDDIELELQLVASKSGQAGAKLGWGILSAEAGAHISSERTHRLTLKLKLPPNAAGGKFQISGDTRSPLGLGASICVDAG